MFLGIRRRVDCFFQLSKEVGVDLAVQTKVLALRKDLLIVETSHCATFYSFMFEFDLRSFVWVGDPTSSSWRFHNVFRECCMFLGLELNG